MSYLDSLLLVNLESLKDCRIKLSKSFYIVKSLKVIRDGNNMNVSQKNFVLVSILTTSIYCVVSEI